MLYTYGMSAELPQIPENSVDKPGLPSDELFKPTAEQLAAFETVYGRVIEELPELADDISKSLETPHIGPYHCEGDMLQHLQLMIQTLDDMQTGRFVESLPEGYAERFRLLAQEQTRSWEQFIFLHDVEKPNCMQLKLATEPKSVRVDISWEEWKAIEAAGRPYRFVDPASGQEAVIESTAFFHQGNKAMGRPAASHGQAAADRLSDVEAHPGVDEAIIPLIADHELAFSFQDRINTRTYTKHIAENPELANRIDELMLVNYLDLASSWRAETGKPNIDSLLNMMVSRANYELVQQVVAEYAAKGVEVKEAEINRLYKLPVELNREMVEQELHKS